MKLVDLLVALAIVGILFAVFASTCRPAEVEKDMINMPIVARVIEGGLLTRWYDLNDDGKADVKVTYRFAKRNGEYIFREISREVSTLEPLVRR